EPHFDLTGRHRCLHRRCALGRPMADCRPARRGAGGVATRTPEGKAMSGLADLQTEAWLRPGSEPCTRPAAPHGPHGASQRFRSPRPWTMSPGFRVAHDVEGLRRALRHSAGRAWEAIR